MISKIKLLQLRTTTIAVILAADTRIHPALLCGISILVASRRDIFDPIAVA
jgi:hypothetical protein